MSTSLLASTIVIVLAALLAKGASSHGPVSQQSALVAWPDSASIEGLTEDDDIANAIGFETAPNSKRSGHFKSSQSADISSVLSAYRGGGHPFCSCQSVYDIKDMGHMRFPRYMRFAMCQPTPCWKAPYVCRQRHYRVPILAKRPELPEDEDDAGNAAEDNNLPESLRRHWKIEFIRIPVACECAMS